MRINRPFSRKKRAPAPEETPAYPYSYHTYALRPCQPSPKSLVSNPNCLLLSSDRLLQIIAAINPDILQFGKVLEMHRTMHIIVEALRNTHIHINTALLAISKA